MTGASSAAFFMYSRAGAGGANVRPSMDSRQPSIIVLCAGLNVASGNGFSANSRRMVDRVRRR